MYTFDASSIIYAWENYPIDIFPSLWLWMEERVAIGEFTMPEPAYAECMKNCPDCETWLSCCNIQRHGLNNNILHNALTIKGSLHITDDYHKKGVGENDILIISTAKDKRLNLVSNEEPQSQVPKILAKCKIPLVCRMPLVSVKCLSFLALLTELQPDLRGYED